MLPVGYLHIKNKVLCVTCMHQVFNKFKAILNTLTIYNQAINKSSACSNIKKYMEHERTMATVSA